MIPKPGGDKIGRRRLDTHFVGIQKLGACFSYDAERQLYEIEAKRLKGAYMLLDEASVTGTANILMAAVLAEGTTIIYNAACEPDLQQLSSMLNQMGARISGVGSNLLTIEGVESLGRNYPYHFAGYDRSRQLYRYGSHDRIGHHHKKYRI